MQLFVYLVFIVVVVSEDIDSLPDLPVDHYSFYLRNNRDKVSFCENSPRCRESRISESRINRTCWGYEDDCLEDEHKYKIAECPDDHKGWVQSKTEQLASFSNQADFKYVKERRQELRTFCKPKSSTSSSLECTRYTKFCRGKNIMINFANLVDIKEPMRYSGDVLSDGHLQGYNCDYDRESLLNEGGHKSPLQSWFEEVEHFQVSPTKLQCDITIDKPTYLMKLDATVNMYHHFCDFINLYLTLHMNNSFSTDNNILIWDTFPYRSNFAVTWDAFTSNPVLDLNSFRGKRVCFKDIVFSFLPRMIFGLYYNMPLIPGCHGSGFFKAFNRHVLHKLHVKTENLASRADAKEVRITLLSRSTRHRKISNEKELIAALKKKSRKFVVRRVDFTHAHAFIDQLKVIANTDILIGMHGAGLTHSLFLPDWAVLFELYNCDDENCYKDLARLRGVKYLTWQKGNLVFPEDEGNHPQLGAHKKFTDYAFDKNEFLRLVMIGVKHVRKEIEKSLNHEKCGEPGVCEEMDNNLEANTLRDEL